MWRTITAFCALLGAVRGQTTAVNQCTNHAGGLPINTYIEGCLTPTCDLPSLQDTVIHMVFRAPYTMRRMETLATAYLWFVPIVYNLGEHSVTCNFLDNTYCPVMAGEVVQYTLRMYMEAAFPVGTITTVEFRVVDENRVPILCVRVPIRIVAPIGRTGNSTLLVN